MGPATRRRPHRRRGGRAAGLRGGLCGDAEQCADDGPQSVGPDHHARDDRGSGAGRKIPEQDYLSNSITLILNSSITGSKISETLKLNLETYQRSHRNEVLKAIKKSEVWLLGPLGLCFLPTFMLIAVVPLIGSLITGFMS